MGRIKVLVRKPLNQPLELVEIDNNLKEVQRIVEGYIEVIKIRKDITCVCNDEGMLKHLEHNYYNDEYGWILGTVVFCSFNHEGEFISLSQEQIDFVKDYIGFPVVDKTNV